MLTLRRTLALVAVALAALAAPVAGPTLTAQSPLPLFEAGRPGARPTERPVRPFQARKARLRLSALDAPVVRLNLFDNADRIAERTRVEQKGANRFIWHGRTDDGGIVTFAIVNGVTTGTVFLDGRSFEIIPDADGDYTIEEINAAAFPSEDAPVEQVDDEADRGGDSGGTTSPAEPTEPTEPPTATNPAEIAVMVLWTPAARAAQGSVSGIQSLVLAAVANANLSYGNSGVPVQLTLVYSGEVPLTETSSISSDLSALRSPTDGKIDNIHALRDQYGADIVSLIGNGYAAKGYCGVGYLMSSPSTSFASSAFNIVDRTCAAGYLSFAHEVGHNQGLQHDPANAGSSPSYSYAYGYQDPGNAFRTVLSYGGATRVPYLSNPLVLYNGRVTGTATQNNAKALTNTAAVVAAFRGSVAPSCSYSVSPTSLSLGSGAGTATVSVTTSEGCGWTASSPASWATVSSGGSGSGTVTVSVTANGTTSRSATLTIAGRSVAVSQAAATCSYTVSPTSLSFAAGAATAGVTVTTSAGCDWTTSSPSAWVAVSGGGSGSGTATVSVTANGTTSRSATLTIAGKSVTVSQEAATCSYSLTPTTLSFSAGAGTAAVSVTASAGCSWTASSPAAWAAVSGGGTGSGTATVSVAANGTTSRSATLTIAGTNVTVSQAALACSYEVTPTSLTFSSAAGTATVVVSAPAGCGWTSSGSTTWATVSGSGSGSGSASVQVSANTAASRSGTVTVAGKAVSLWQAGKSRK